jgi:hypothetical protein
MGLCGAQAMATFGQPSLPSNLGHVFSIRGGHSASLLACLTRFFGRELVGQSSGVGGLAATARDLSHPLFVKGREASALFGRDWEVAMFVRLHVGLHGVSLDGWCCVVW